MINDYLSVHTVRTCIYSDREEGRGESLTREKVRGTIVHKAGSKNKNTNMTDKHLLQSPL